MKRLSCCRGREASQLKYTRKIIFVQGFGLVFPVAPELKFELGLAQTNRRVPNWYNRFYFGFSFSLWGSKTHALRRFRPVFGTFALCSQQWSIDLAKTSWSGLHEQLCFFESNLLLICVLLEECLGHRNDDASCRWHMCHCEQQAARDEKYWHHWCKAWLLELKSSQVLDVAGSQMIYDVHTCMHACKSVRSSQM